MSTMKLIVEIDGTPKLEMKRELTEVPPSKGPIVMPGLRESPPLREIARAFMGGDRHGTPADSVTALKKLSQAGDSLTVAVTKEAKEIGLSKGDIVYITLERVME